MLTAPSEEIYIRDEPIQVIEEIQALEGNFRAIKALPEEAQRIIFCESSNMEDALNENLNEDGSAWSRDYGYWQINDYYHEEKASGMGLDIKNPGDNIKYGEWLYQTEGSKAWSASQQCWSDSTLKIN